LDSALIIVQGSVVESRQRVYAKSRCQALPARARAADGLFARIDGPHGPVAQRTHQHRVDSASRAHVKRRALHGDLRDRVRQRPRHRSNRKLRISCAKSEIAIKDVQKKRNAG
jgi:hypothetical protein